MCVCVCVYVCVCVHVCACQYSFSDLYLERHLMCMITPPRGGVMTQTAKVIWTTPSSTSERVCHKESSRRPLHMLARYNKQKTSVYIHAELGGDITPLCACTFFKLGPLSPLSPSLSLPSPSPSTFLSLSLSSG